MKKQSIYFFCVLGLATLPLSFFSGCGLVGSAGNLVGQQNSGVSNAGNGATPQLRTRIQNDPSLGGKDCEGHNTCEDTCDDIYEERDSRENCYNLSISRVSDLEDVFFAFLNWNADDLEDIDEDHFKKYLEIGLDGFTEKLVSRIKRRYTGNKVYERIAEILHNYIIEEKKTVVPVLESADPKNEVLRSLILAHCDLNSNHQCKNTTKVTKISSQLCQLKVDSSGVDDQNSKRPILNNPSGDCKPKDTTTNNIWYCPERTTSSDVEVCYHNDAAIKIKIGTTEKELNSSDNNSDYVVFDYDNSEMYYCHEDSSDPTCSSGSGTTLKHKKLASIEDDEADLFVALVGAGKVFFNDSASNEHRAIDAFSLGHDLLNQACNGNTQCKKLFYCYLNDKDNSNIKDEWFSDSKVREKLDETIESIDDCDYSS